MYDPDAVFGTHIHWMISNIKNRDINSGVELIPYKGPAPPPKTGKHRYIIELYEKNLLNTDSFEERSISIGNLRKKLGLNIPVNKIQFISQNENGGKRNKTKNKKSKKRLRLNKNMKKTKKFKYYIIV